jgi:hypothetical protein
MEFREIYCENCKKILGRYNIKFYDENKIEEILKIDHSIHVRKGHEIYLRNFIQN